VHNLMKIEFSSAIEIVSAKFDNALELADKEAMVYGGVVRDMLAGLPLKGDLDIVASYDSYLDTLENFRMSGKWIEEYNRGRKRTVDFIRSSGYRKNKSIGETVTFKTFADTKVQLIRAKSRYTREVSKTNLEVVKSVDIICCGLIMDINGNIFEVLDNAHSDCVNRILRLNKSKHTLNIQTLQERITKLSDRGWKSKINIEKVEKMLREIEEARQREPERRFDFDIGKYIVYSKASNLFTSKIVVDEELVRILKGPSSVKNIAYRAVKHTGVRVKMSPYSHRPTSFTIFLEFASDIDKLKPALIDVISEKLVAREHFPSGRGRHSESYGQDHQKTVWKVGKMGVGTELLQSKSPSAGEVMAWQKQGREAITGTDETAEVSDESVEVSDEPAEVPSDAPAGTFDNAEEARDRVRRVRGETRSRGDVKRDIFRYQYGLSSQDRHRGRT